MDPSLVTTPSGFDSATGAADDFICGDDCFLEALLSLEGKAPDSWGPEKEKS